MFILGLTLDYYRNLAERIVALTALQVREALLRHLNPNALRVIAVGDRAKIAPQLQALKLGGAPVQLRADGTPVATPRPAAAPASPRR
jgi:zinc protease